MIETKTIETLTTGAAKPIPIEARTHSMTRLFMLGASEGKRPIPGFDDSILYLLDNGKKWIVL